MKTLKVYGPPGTGKTFTLLELFENELKQVKPDRIGFCTFTRTARLEALERTKLTEEEVPFVKTLHAICYKLLGARHDQLVMPKHIKAFGQKMGVRLSGYMPDPLSLESLTEGAPMPSQADRLLQLNHLGRHRGQTLREAMKLAPLEFNFAYAKWFTEGYRNWKNTEGLLDYTDLLTLYLTDGPPLPVDVLFIDEAQDLSWLQWRVAHKLAANIERRYLAGDDDQAIFVWAGASADMFNTEPADEIRVLPKSYRLSRAVFNTSQKIITRVKVRQPKEFHPRDEEGHVQPVTGINARDFEHGSTLCLFRNHHRGARLAGQLEEEGIAFKGSHGLLGQEAVRGALTAWEKLEKEDQITKEEARYLVDFTPNGMLQHGVRDRLAARGPSVLNSVAILNAEALKLPWNKVMLKLPKLWYLERVIGKHGMQGVLDPKVSLVSIHQSKGREADTVVLDLEMARRTYDAYVENPDDEHRVMYVAVTRARDRLFTLLPTDPMSYVL